MKTRSRFFVANIVLGVVVAIIVVIDLFIILSVNSAMRVVDLVDEMEWSDLLDELYEMDEFDEYEDYYEYVNYRYILVSLEDAYAERLGTEYDGRQAESGYQFYMVHAMVHNAGTNYMETKYLDLDFYGEEYSDVIWDYVIGDFDDPFYYSNQEIVPSCQTAEVECLIQVQDGVTEFVVELTEDYETNSKDMIILTLE